MKVLIIYPKLTLYGGAELLLVRLCNYMTANGISNAILTTSITDEISADLVDTEIILSKNEKIRSASITADIILNEIKALKAGLKKISDKFDVMNPHNYPAEIVAMSSDKPSVWMCNEPEIYLTLTRPDFGKLVLREKLFILRYYMYEKIFLKKRITKAVVSDDFNAERFKRIFGFNPTIIHYGIDYDTFSVPPQNSGGRNELQGKFIILHVGLVTPLKNQLDSLRTFVEIKDRIPEAYMVFAGTISDAGYHATLKNFIEKNDLAGKVEFIGHVNRAELKKLYYRADVMLHPIKSQGGWLSPFEILCAGKPVVVSREMTASYIIERENIGIVTDKYAESIYEIYCNKTKYNEMAARGKEYVRNNLTWDVFCKNMVRLFESTTVKNR